MTGTPIKVQCTECNGFHDPAPNADFDTLSAMACTEVDATTQDIYETFGINRSGGRWDIDDKAGVITFTMADGRACDADYGFVGTWAVDNETFKWGWDHPYATDATRAAADEVLKQGKALDAKVLATNLLKLPEREVWHLVSIAAFLAQLPAIFRGRANEKAWMYFAFGRPTWRAA